MLGEQSKVQDNVLVLEGYMQALRNPPKASLHAVYSPFKNKIQAKMPVLIVLVLVVGHSIFQTNQHTHTNSQLSSEIKITRAFI